MAFPIDRPRRLRMTPTIRRMVRETVLTPHDFILPLFLVEGRGKDYKAPIESMPGCFHYSPDRVVEAVREAHSVGVQAVLLFGLPHAKDHQGSRAWAADGVVQQGIKAIKDAVPDMCVICDVCLCEYTDHGHCGVLKGETVDNDATLPLLAQTAVSQARAGVNMVAPSDMMDGRVAAIRQALDQEGFKDVAIMSYAAKFASSFYGPFRCAVESTPSFGDRTSYQMDPGNARESVMEIATDLEEGADIIIVKPALPYLDIIKAAWEKFDRPVAAYQVSGEYAMIKGAAAVGLVNEEQNMMESLTCIKRAGAQMIITYFAVEAAKTLIRRMVEGCPNPWRPDSGK